MSSEQVVANRDKLITTKQLLRSVLKTLDGQYTQEEVQKKITDSGLSLDGKYHLVEIVRKISFNSPAMGSENEDYEANWVEALRQLAVRLNDNEALQVIAAAKKSMEVAHTQGTFSADKNHPRDLNNNLVKTSGGGSFDSIRKSDREEQKKKELEILKIINDLKVQEDPLTPTESEDNSISDEKKA
ncbi:uncharacterized protein [Halyomorpha halys]|uniref:uncharacterized protein n=1 Tax=Halyomorpha halys TaxID=286706 RepID=UPI0006D4FF47|nr:uncharacterized protein LOC106682151 [Halyomorpha halys]